MLTARPDGRNAALDGLRGYAAAVVVIYHGILGCSPNIVPDVLYQSVLTQQTAYGWALKTALSLLSGEGAVALFFAMSGMVLFRALSSMARRQTTTFELSWRFLLRRLLRLWPPMAICLVAHFLLLAGLAQAAPGFTEWHPLSDLLTNLTLVATPLHGATWTLAVELAAAPWMLAFFLAMRRWGALPVVPVFVAAVLVSRHNGLLREPAGMAMGLPLMLAGAWLESGLAARLSRLWAWRHALPVGAALVVIDEMLTPFRPGWLHLLLLLLGASLVVAAVATANAGPAHRLLQRPLSRTLGRISYSLYLWNVPVLLILLGFVSPEHKAAHPLEIGLAIGVAAVLVTIPLAMLAERWTERPFIELGRALTRASPQPQAQPLAS